MTLRASPRASQRAAVASYVAIGALFAASGCVRQLSPAPTPERVAPAVPADAPLEEGHGRVIIDVVDGPISLYRVHMQPEPTEDDSGRMHYVFEESHELLCDPSPCATDLPTGNALLGFPRLGDGDIEVDLVHVSPRTTVYRRSLSSFENNQGPLYITGFMGASLGASAAIVGAVLMPAGLLDRESNLMKAGGITFGTGAVTLALGALAMWHDSARYRPGSSRHFAAP